MLIRVHRIRTVLRLIVIMDYVRLVRRLLTIRVMGSSVIRILIVLRRLVRMVNVFLVILMQ